MNAARTCHVLLLCLIAVPAQAAVPPPGPAPASSTVEEVIGALSRVQPFREVALSPDGKKVAWIEAILDKDGPAPRRSAIFVADVLGPRRAPRRITAGGQKGGCAEHELAWAPDGRRLAFLSDAAKERQMQLYLADTESGRVERLTSLSGHLTDPRFSPDGRTLAVLFIENRADLEGPERASPRDTGVVGEAPDAQQITLVDPAKKTARQVSPPGLHVYEYDWSPDGKAFAATAAPGPGDANWWVAGLVTIAADTGQRRSIFQPPRQIAEPRWSPDGQSLAFIGGLMSDEGVTGGDVFVVPAQGGPPRNLTPRMKASATSLTWISEGQLLFTEIADGAAGVASLDTATGQIGRPYTAVEVFSRNGWRVGLSLSRDGKTAAVIRHSFTRPPEIWAGPIGSWQQVTHRNDGVTPLWGEGGSLHWKSDGQDVQGFVLRPRDMDPTRRYPMVVVVHGGPTSAHTAGWPRHIAGPLASQGYVVLLPNPRGSFGQGEAFAQGNVKDFGRGDLRDILQGVDAVLRSEPVDPERLGITGWSYGGFMTMWAVTQTPRFRAAVAGAGISNWQSYYGQNRIDQWMLPYFGASVYDDPPVYARSSPINFIKNARTPTLVLQGERDAEVPAPQAYEFWHALRALGVKTQLVIYPDEGHDIERPEHRKDLMKRLCGWFEQHLR